MKRTLLTAAAAFALAIPAGAVVAQDTMVATDAAGNTYVMTEEQKGMYSAWPVERQTLYTAWPSTYQTYFWTLTPAQQGGWWVLTDDQRGRIYAMTPDQREAAWTAIASQMGAATPVADTSAPAGQMQFVKREMAQPVQGSADAAALQSGDLPICKPDQQDGCINGWEKGRKGNKPLDYWPGKPASELPASAKK